ncbi:MAG: hypothetical protein ACE5EK_10355 [Nitrospinales bacterium]
MVKRILNGLQKKYPEMEVESIEALTHPSRLIDEKIRMLPALKIGKDILSGFILKPKDIHQFIESHQAESTT